ASYLLLLRQLRSPPTSTLFPYTTLFRSQQRRLPGVHDHAGRRGVVLRGVALGRRDVSPPQEAVPRPRPVDGRRRRRRVRAEPARSEEHTSELQSLAYLVCRLLLVEKNSR